MRQRGQRLGLLGVGLACLFLPLNPKARDVYTMTLMCTVQRKFNGAGLQRDGGRVKAKCDIYHVLLMKRA